MAISSESVAETRRDTPLLIVFTSLSGFYVQALRQSDDITAEGLDNYYQCLATAAAEARGTVVKFIGDGALIVFPEEAVALGIGRLLTARQEIDQEMTRRGWECRFTAK